MTSNRRGGCPWEPSQPNVALHTDTKPALRALHRWAWPLIKVSPANLKLLKDTKS